MVKSQVMEETRVEYARITLLRLLRVRTKQDAPADLVDTIQATADLAQLEGCLDIAANVISLDAFRQQTGL